MSHRRFFSVLMGIGIAVLAMSATLSAAEPAFEIQADRFEVDAVSQEMMAAGNLNVTRGLIKIKGSSAKYNKTNKRLLISGPVRLTSPKLQLTCNKIEAFETENKILASGDVKFTFEKITGNSDEAEYNLKNEIVTLSGNAKAWRDDDFIVGQKIVLYIRENKMVTTGKTKMVFSEERLQKK